MQSLRKLSPESGRLDDVACVIYFLRYLDAVGQVAQLVDMLEQTGSTYYLGNVSLVSYVGRFVMLGGSVLAILIVFNPRFGAADYRISSK